MLEFHPPTPEETREFVDGLMRESNAQSRQATVQQFNVNELFASVEETRQDSRPSSSNHFNRGSASWTKPQAKASLFSDSFYKGNISRPTRSEEIVKKEVMVLIFHLTNNSSFYIPFLNTIVFRPDVSIKPIEELLQEKRTEIIDRKLHQIILPALNQNESTFSSVLGTFSKKLEDVELRVLNTTLIQHIELVSEQDFLKRYNPRSRMEDAPGQISNPLE